MDHCAVSKSLPVPAPTPRLRSHAPLSCCGSTGDKHVHILDASTKRVVVCLDASYPAAGVVGGAMHAGAWDGDDHFIIVDMTGSVNGVAGGALHKFQIDLANGVGYLYVYVP